MLSEEGVDRSIAPGSSMRVALVTGAGRGQGEAIAVGLAARGFHVVANDIHLAAAERTAARVRAAGGSAEPFHADVANRVAVGAMVQEIRARWGRLDLVVHHAEVHPHRALLEMGEYEWDRTVAVILKGAFLLLQAAAPGMIAQGRGAFAFLAPSGVLERGGFHAAYGAGKAGLIFLAHVAREALDPMGVAVHLLLTEGPEAETDLEAALDLIARLDGMSRTLRIRARSAPVPAIGGGTPAPSGADDSEEAGRGG